MPILRANRRDAAFVVTAAVAPADPVRVGLAATIVGHAPAAGIATIGITAGLAMTGADRAVVLVENLASRDREVRDVRVGRREIATVIAGRARHRSRCVRSCAWRFCRSR
ncbi:MAG: hypothetical protein RL088_2507 [Verrucomicrobiota bacterium]|jgi:hypothetical protein